MSESIGDQRPLAAMPKYLVDEILILQAHDRMVASDDDLRRHIELINGALECLSRLPESHKEGDEKELAVLRLSVRCFNSGAGSIRLQRCGYFQPAMMLVRDLIEVSHLLNLFKKMPAELDEWLSLPEKERQRRFKPVAVRERLDKFDGFKERKREKIYGMFNQLAAHPNPNGHHLISPDNITRIGPFIDYSRFKAGIEELATHVGNAAVCVCNLVRPNTLEALREKDVFLKNLHDWMSRYFRKTDDSAP